MTDTEKHLLDSIRTLINQYGDDEYMKNKLSSYLTEQLPQLLANAEKNKIEREQRRKALTESSESFVSKFLNENIFLYSQTATSFFQYDKKHYYMYSEDDIIYEVLKSITVKPELHPWKHKIKVQLLKSIKDRPLWSCIPESNTIQFVHKLLCPSIFSNKVHTKHFLCVIGDCLRKKNENNIHLISSGARFLIKILSEFGTAIFGHNIITSTFKYKYYDHTFGDCRLIKVQPLTSDASLENKIKRYILDILCVSYYYSQRYNGADNFIQEHKDSNEGKYILFLSERTSESLVAEFISSTITVTNSFTTKQHESTISFKMMNYLWKSYLHNIDIPNVLFVSQLKSALENKLTYDENQDCYVNVTSNYLPSVQSFLQYWADNIIGTDSEVDELEIEELLTYLRKFNSKVFGSSQSNDILAMLCHFFPDVIIEDDKYILSIRLNCWNKSFELENFLSVLKDTGNKGDMSLDKAYELYARQKCQNQIIVGKRYFTKYIIETLGDFIFDDRYILQSWFA